MAERAAWEDDIRAGDATTWRPINSKFDDKMVFDIMKKPLPQCSPLEKAPYVSKLVQADSLVKIGLSGYIDHRKSTHETQCHELKLVNIYYGALGDSGVAYRIESLSQRLHKRKTFPYSCAQHPTHKGFITECFKIDEHVAVQSVKMFSEVIRFLYGTDRKLLPHWIRACDNFQDFGPVDEPDAARLYRIRQFFIANMPLPRPWTLSGDLDASMPSDDAPRATSRSTPSQASTEWSTQDLGFDTKEPRLLTSGCETNDDEETSTGSYRAAGDFTFRRGSPIIFGKLPDRFDVYEQGNQRATPRPHQFSNRSGSNTATPRVQKRPKWSHSNDGPFLAIVAKILTRVNLKDPWQIGLICAIVPTVYSLVRWCLLVASLKLLLPWAFSFLRSRWMRASS